MINRKKASRKKEIGYTVIELLISLVVAALLLTGLQQLLTNSLSVLDAVEENTDLTRQARFAMSRMVEAVRAGDKLLIPQADMPGTPLSENVRGQTFPASPPQAGSTLDTAVLAITIDPQQDMNRDGVADADNDGDGQIDEDLPADNANDGKPGIRDFDDDGNGTTDFFLSPAADDDESNDFSADEDPANGIDDDGDGSVDEDPGADVNGDGAPGVAGVDDDGDNVTDEGDINDDDEDGQVDEDWYDPVVFYLNGATLVERRVVPWDENTDSIVNGQDFVESEIASNVSLLRFERLAPATAEHRQLVDISLTLTDASGESISLSTRVRLGASR